MTSNSPSKPLGPGEAPTVLGPDSVNPSADAAAPAAIANRTWTGFLPATLILLNGWFVPTLSAADEPLAFPGAMGHARHAVGGRGGQVVIVDTLEDVVDADDGVTSLREALTVHDEPRTIVFNVGGLFDLGDRRLPLRGEAASRLTLACQSAPAPGVTIRTAGLVIQNAHDVIFRHCRIRGVDPGSASGASAGRNITVAGGGTRDIMLDHLSMSWATDENFQVYLDAEQEEGIRNVTLSNSLVAEGDSDSTHELSVKHPKWYYHSMGPSCNNNNESFPIEGCSIVRNFIAHNSARNGMIWGGQGELIGNVIYNWYGHGLTARPQYGQDVEVHVIGNLLKPGPSTVGSDSVNCESRFNCALYLGMPETDNHPRYAAVSSRYVVDDNWFVETSVEGTRIMRMDDHPNRRGSDGAASSSVRITPSLDDIVVEAHPDSAHMRCIGASVPERDAVDSRIVQEYRTGTGTVGIGNKPSKGESASARERSFDDYRQQSRRSEDFDTDRDGMADQWEQANRLNPKDAGDAHEDIDGDGYTNIEAYLHFLAESCKEAVLRDTR